MTPVLPVRYLGSGWPLPLAELTYLEYLMLALWLAQTHWCYAGKHSYGHRSLRHFRRLRHAEDASFIGFHASTTTLMGKVVLVHVRVYRHTSFVSLLLDPDDLGSQSLWVSWEQCRLSNIVQAQVKLQDPVQT